MVRLTVEVREAGGQLHGVMVTEGRAASGGRAEVFAPGSVRWPGAGVGIVTEHLAEPVATGFPHRAEGGAIELRAKANDAIREAIGAGKRYMSVEFRALEERTTAGGVREVLSAFVDRVALVSDPEYDTTRAEVRSKASGADLVPIEWLL